MHLVGMIRALQIIACVGCVSMGVLPTAHAQSDLNNRKIDGYKGIWFSLGQFSEYGDKYSGGLATYTAKHTPLSIYVPEAEKTYFVYGGTTGPYDRYLLCMIGSYDHRTGTVSRPTVVYDKQAVDDPHDNPSLAVDGEGYLWVFVSGRGRGRPGFKFKSREPYSIDAFDQIAEEEMTYPQPHYIPGKGFLHLFTKYTGVRELYFETSRDGLHWTEGKKLAGMREPGDPQGGHYQVSGQAGEKVGFFFNWHPNGDVDRRSNVYYMQSVDFGTTWTTVEGHQLKLPLTQPFQTPALVQAYYTQGKNVYLKDMAFDEQGNPMALYLISSGHLPGPHGDRQWTVLRWNGMAWESHAVAGSDHNYDTGCLLVKEGKWIVVAPTKNLPQPWGGGGEIEMWESSDQGKTWNVLRQLTRRSARNHNYVRKSINGRDPFLYFWADGNPDTMSESVLYFGDSKGNVWRLPYDMQNEHQKPVRVSAP